MNGGMSLDTFGPSTMRVVAELYGQDLPGQVIESWTDGHGWRWQRVLLDLPTVIGGVGAPARFVDVQLRALRQRPQSERCPECGCIGSHGLVHVRYGNGGGGNRPCSLSTDQEAGR